MDIRDRLLKSTVEIAVGTPPPKFGSLKFGRVAVGATLRLVAVGVGGVPVGVAVAVGGVPVAVGLGV